LEGINEPKWIFDQLKTLSDIHRKDFRNIELANRKCFDALELTSLQRVYALGDGDSYHAALATELAFNVLTGTMYSPLPAMRFLEYTADYIPVNFPRDTLVIGISASGRSTRVIQSIERAQNKSKKIIAVGLSGDDDSPLVEAADRTLSVQIEDLGRIPGVRTYTASLLGLFGIAIRIGEIKHKYHMNQANKMRKLFVDMADMMDATLDASIKAVGKAVELIKESPFISYVGSGPSFGTALFSSAKIVEASGVFSVAQDLEEWAHVERFCYPLDYPVVIVAPPGKGYWRAQKLAEGIKLLGHPLIAVVDEEDKGIAPLADAVLPVVGEVEEMFSPLLYYIPGTLLAYQLAEALGRKMFMTDNEVVMALREKMIKQIRGDDDTGY
jgi:glucosamine--fructose-6-phosphate aminotransferase (isomerizing)